MRSAALLIGLFVCGAWSQAFAAPPKDKVHVILAGVEIPPDVPPAVGDRAKEILADALGKRPEFVLALDGAPDPDKDPAGYRDYLKKNNLRSYSVTAKVASYVRSVDPDPKASTGQLLKYHVELSLVGASIPDKLLALGGAGSSTIIQQVGKNILPADDKYGLEESLKEAIDLAIDDSLAKLSKGKSK